MGYTHYFHGTGEQEIDSKALVLIKSLLKEGYDKKIIQKEYDNDSEPVVTDKLIQFNGIGDDGHETFDFDISQTGFKFCKTAFKQYDYYVTRVLLILKYYHNIELSSDGDFTNKEEWGNALKWAQGHGVYLLLSTLLNENENEDDKLPY